MLTSMEPAEIVGCACDGYTQLEQMVEARARETTLVLVDLDGTLLTHDKRVTSATVAAVRAAEAAGVMVVPATGRALTALPEELFGLVRYAVCGAGSSVFELGASVADSTMLMERGLAPMEACRLVKGLLDRFGTDVFVDVGVGGRVLTSEDQLARLRSFAFNPDSIDYVRRTRELGLAIPEGIAELDAPVGRLNLFYRAPELRDKIMAWLRAHADVELANSLGSNIEVNAHGTSKWGGLQWLAEHEGVPADRVLALGDGSNDADMLAHAWLGVAMRDAQGEVLRAAQARTAYTNDQEGVARVLREVVALKSEDTGGE